MRIWHDGNEATRWGLDWHVRDIGDRTQWTALLAAKILSLGWHTWWMDVACLADTMRLPAGQALELWGEHFWNAYAGEALVLLDVGEDRRAVYQAVRHWEGLFASVRFSPPHDYDGRAPEEQPCGISG